METLERNEWADVAQLVEITSDAVIICELDGTILHVNNRLLDLMCEERADVINGDVKDVLYSSAFERATEHRLPFETDGCESELMLKLSDGPLFPSWFAQVPLRLRVSLDAARRASWWRFTASKSSIPTIVSSNVRYRSLGWRINASRVPFRSL